MSPAKFRQGVIKIASQPPLRRIGRDCRCVAVDNRVPVENVAATDLTRGDNNFFLILTYYP